MGLLISLLFSNTLILVFSSTKQSMKQKELLIIKKQ